MLLSITIRNIALIQELTIPFHDGLHVLTGETGAGKSIVVDAVNLVLGGRADKDLIRTGCEKAYVEAVFDVKDNRQVRELLNEQQIETDDGILTISREISLSGRNTCRIMGMVMQLSYLKQLTALLMDVHGQHEHQFLMDPKYHLRFLDEYGGEAQHLLLEELNETYTSFMDIHKEYVKLHKAANDREQRMDTLRFQRDELTKARLVRGEEEGLQTEKQTLRYAEKIQASLNEAYENTYAAPSNAASLVKAAGEALRTIADIAPVYGAAAEKLESLYYELEDVGLTLRDMNQQESFDPARAEQIDERLDLIHRLSRKYGPDTGAMLDYLENVSDELQILENLEDKLSDIQNEHRQKLKVYREKARQVTDARKKLALRFESLLIDQLKDLGMGNTCIKAAFYELPPEAKKPMPSPSGDDQVELLISPNPGEPLKPLSKIASGGELSRLMLGIKAIAAQTGQVDSMVFDEIDTGISGRMAQTVAEKMNKIAQIRQVICVSHLPQIAAMADHQYLVEKSVHNERTQTTVSIMDDCARRQMIARMIGGADGEDRSALAHAEAMINAAKAMKAQN